MSPKFSLNKIVWLTVAKRENQKFVEIEFRSLARLTESEPVAEVRGLLRTVRLTEALAAKVDREGPVEEARVGHQ